MLRDIRLLSLDVTNTLIRLAKPPAVTYANLAREFGFNEVDQDAVGRSFVTAFHRLEVEKPCFGFYGAGSKDWWTDLLRECYGREIAEHKSFPLLVDRAFEYFGKREAWCLTNKQNLDSLRRLSLVDDLNIAIVSNFDSRLHSILDAFGISEFVDSVMISGEVGYQKPDPKIFDLLLNHFRITDPKLALHVGDNLKRDYLGATAAGMNALLLTDEQCPNIPQNKCIRSIAELE